MPADQNQGPAVQQEESSSAPDVQILNLPFSKFEQLHHLGYTNHSTGSLGHSGTASPVMLNAAAMKDLLSANVDENASHFAFFSAYGTIMGHDHAADVKAVKRFTAFAANTWGHNEVSLKESGKTVAPLTPGTTILQAVITEDGSGLYCLMVQVDDLVGAVTHVREGTLLAALRVKEDFAGEGDEVAGKIKGIEGSKKADEGTGGVAEKGSGSSDASGGSKVDDGSMGGSSGAEDEGREKGKGKAGEGDGEGEEKKPTKMQILALRSEGMAQYMADELGPNFKIPKGFY